MPMAEDKPYEILWGLFGGERIRFGLNGLRIDKSGSNPDTFPG